MSIGMLKEKREQVIAWRGPMLDRALAQLLTEVYWGDLDFLLVDMPPGTGDMAMSVAGQLPKSQVVVVTTPQSAAAEVAERAGTLAGMLKQPVLGVIENMSWLETVCPHCGKTHRVEVFGAGGGDAVASALTLSGQRTVPLLAQVPMDIKLRNGGDVGVPIVLSAPEEPAAQAIRSLADRLIEARQATLS
jgi:ATP-binding protein involved in chromosome partitioning